MDVIHAIFVFIAYIIVDALYALYTIYIQRGNAIKAGLSGTLMYAITTFGIILAIKEPIYIIFVALGSFVGTYIIVKLNR